MLMLLEIAFETAYSMLLLMSFPLFGASAKHPHGVTSYGVCHMRLAETMLLKGFIAQPVAGV